jgi:DNA-binding protein H-NS
MQTSITQTHELQAKAMQTSIDHTNEQVNAMQTAITQSQDQVAQILSLLQASSATPRQDAQLDLGPAAYIYVGPPPRSGH